METSPSNPNSQTLRNRSGPISPLKSEYPSTPRMTASPSMTKCFWRFFRAASTTRDSGQSSHSRFW